MDKTFTTRIQNKKDTKANWESQNPVLLDGELIMIEDENGNLFYKVGDGTSNYSALPFVGAPIKYVESLDTDNMLNLRDLESGTYILYGKFHPYSGSTSTCTFSTGMTVSVIKATSTSYIQIFYAKNNTIQYLEITDETYARTDAKLINMESTANKVTDIDETADDTHYPSARAVRNAFCNNLVVDATSTDGITYTEVDGITELYEGLQITIRPDISNTSNAMTLNVNGLGDKPIRRPLSFSTYVANSADSGFLHKDAPCRLMYHANYPNRVNGVSGTGIWLMADKVEVSAQDLYGRVPVASGGVPSSAAADNGKICSVVEGVAAWKELVTTIDENSDDASVPSAKAVYTLFNEFCSQVNAILETVVNGEGTTSE